MPRRIASSLRPSPASESPAPRPVIRSTGSPKSTAATALDDAIANAYGQRYQLLDATTREAVDEAFEAFDDAFAQGASTTDAVSNMSACVQSVEQLLTTRYDAATRLQPT